MTRAKLLRCPIIPDAPLCIKYILVLAPPHPAPSKMEEDESKNIVGLLLVLHSNVFIRSRKAVLQQISCIITTQCCLSCTLWVWKSRLFQDILNSRPVESILSLFKYFSRSVQTLRYLVIKYMHVFQRSKGIRYNLLHHEAGPCRVQEGFMLQCTVVNVNECGTEILTAYPTLKLVTSCSSQQFILYKSWFGGRYAYEYSVLKSFAQCLQRNHTSKQDQSSSIQFELTCI